MNTEFDFRMKDGSKMPEPSHSTSSVVELLGQTIGELRQLEGALGKLEGIAPELGPFDLGLVPRIDHRIGKMAEDTKGRPTIPQGLDAVRGQVSQLTEYVYRLSDFLHERMGVVPPLPQAQGAQLMNHGR